MRKLHNSILRFAGFLLAVIILSACSSGGGGGGGDPSSSDPAKGTTWDEMVWGEGKWG